MNPRTYIPAAAVIGVILSLACSEAAACGHERWPVKIGTDQDIGDVDFSHPQSTDIKTLAALPYPSPRPDDSRVNATEKTVFVVDAYITAYAIEADDNDFHLALSDLHRHTMIAEVPDPSCLSTGNPFLSKVTASRHAVDDKLHPTHTMVKHQRIHVRVTGVGFFDKKHGQVGIAHNNAIELHPVLDIQFLP